MSEGFNIFPNPSAREIWIKSNHENVKGIKILNLLGKDVTNLVKISRIGKTSNCLDIISLKTGVYMLQINKVNAYKVNRK